MSVTRNTRQMGTITRIYKNSDGKVIAIDNISIVANVLRLGNTTTDVKFHISIEEPKLQRTLLHLGVGDRIVNSIQQIGDYSSVEINSGNYFIVIWDKASKDEDDVNFSLERYVAKIGDAI